MREVGSIKDGRGKSMSTVDMDIVVANIKSCIKVLKGLQNRARPMAMW